MKATLMASAKTAWKSFYKGFFLFLVAFNALTVYHLVRATLFDARDYYAFNSMVGPVVSAKKPEPEVAMRDPALVGPAATNVYPGDWLAWSAALCLQKGIAGTGHVDLFRPPQGQRIPGMVFAPRDTVILPDDSRCGPKVRTLQIPFDAPPGIYYLRMSMTFREHSYFPLTSEIDSIRLTVLPPKDGDTPAP